MTTARKNSWMKRRAKNPAVFASRFELEGAWEEVSHSSRCVDSKAMLHSSEDQYDTGYRDGASGSW